MCVTRLHLGGQVESVLDADLFGEGSSLISGQPGEGPSEKGSEKIVVTYRELHVDVSAGGLVPLRRATSSGRAPVDFDSQMPRSSEFVEVVTGDVGVEVDGLGNLRGSHPRLGFAYTEVDVASRWVAEC
ncbi:MAG: hypothetical protein ACI8Y4_002845 [Candidatus Poriferisodalaceae bacterium]|jgi:hypothetical protein